MGFNIMEKVGLKKEMSPEEAKAKAMKIIEGDANEKMKYDSFAGRTTKDGKNIQDMYVEFVIKHGKDQEAMWNKGTEEFQGKVQFSSN